VSYVVFGTSVNVSYERPSNVDSYSAIRYRLKYRKLELGEWQAMPETHSKTQAINNLDEHSRYVLRVAAKYDLAGQQLGPESGSVLFTIVGKCCACLVDTTRRSYSQ